MILSKTIELWYKGEYVKSADIKNSKNENYWRTQWRKEYGKKFDSPDVVTKVVVEETLQHEVTEKKSTTPFAAMIKRSRKGIISPHYTESNHWK